MKYSFLVPVYNVEKYLGQCIESMLSQTYKNFEIILVDDGSTDSSGKICDDYAKQHPECIKVIHKQNEGHTATRQVAIKNAESDVCLFVDSDDYVEADMLDKVNDEFSADASLDMVIFSFCYSSNGNKTKRKNCIFKGNEVFEEESKKEIYETLMFTPFINSLWVKATRTDILKSDPTDYSEIYGKMLAEDQYQSVYLVTAAKKIKYINNELYNYRTDNSSITRTFDVCRLNKMNTLFVYNRFIDMLPQWDMNTPETIERLQASWFGYAIYTFNQYYKEAKNSNQRKAVVDFDWDSFLPDFSVSNRYISPSGLKTYKLIKAKKYVALYLLYLKNNYHKIIKKFLREKL